jgi:hypothetical protein
MEMTPRTGPTGNLHQTAFGLGEEAGAVQRIRKAITNARESVLLISADFPDLTFEDKGEDLADSLAATFGYCSDGLTRGLQPSRRCF